MKAAQMRQCHRPLESEMQALDVVNDVLDELCQGEVTGRAVLIP